MVVELSTRDALSAKLMDFAAVQLLVTLPGDPALFRNQVERRAEGGPGSAVHHGRSRPRMPSEPAGCWRRSRRRTPARSAATWRQSGPALSIALNGPETVATAAAALGDVPRVDAQRGLADVAMNGSQTPEIRLAAAKAWFGASDGSARCSHGDQERALLTLGGVED